MRESYPFKDQSHKLSSSIELIHFTCGSKLHYTVEIWVVIPVNEVQLITSLARCSPLEPRGFLFILRLYFKVYLSFHDYNINICNIQKS